ncbi:DJ-1/PfpI family protein [Nocardia cyriacigeorgica]|uniref:DJ-1/PfpI family protein n=1 Tax=Nocardia cyriacigeorgica TaxID=135487 RepID=UPI0018938C00|nr:DJ-1/PfpI family protein [Nocardia cyriacigeorgica]MBF6159550.1 DJ-1/PfpI family protein [Nocardia cyriacigeorgica]MBF6198633.1 DJ-1/PfpI family protein [Nocardia cyriacigeorgica]MBF6342564.1 DJ-1/PfpI family protein [Nocardia cyriacigeorgica]MBF6515088.1 DJ-1/PfpI family protein [Nocardia cyriacigeorgica]
MTTKTVHVAVYDLLADWEVGAAIAQINHNVGLQREPGSFQVRTVAPLGETVTTMGGMRIVPDLALAELDAEDSALLILPGSELWDRGGLSGFAYAARKFLDAGVPVAAICGATFGLAKEGLLDERKHTSGAAEYLAASGYAGADNYVDAPAVTDGGLITAGPAAPWEFAREIFAELELFEPQVLDAWYRLFAKRDASAYPVLAEWEAKAAAAS